jgi:hypothetical protein
MVAHPGHELRVHGWLEKAHPIVCVLTDGSGRTSHSRLDSTTRVLNVAGCIPGAIYGAMADRDLYAAVMNFKHGQFTSYVDELASCLLPEDIECIVGDAAEGYNPAHDICRLIIDAAVTLANSQRRQAVKNFDLTLIGPPDEGPSAFDAEAIYLRLDEPAFARKLLAAGNYPELQAEVAAALSGAGSVGLRQHPDLGLRAGSGFVAPSPEQFAVECLRPVNAESPARHRETPFYELYGERRVTAGHYTQVLRYREHILPLAEAIDAHVRKLMGP